MSLKKYKKNANVALVTDQPGRQILFLGLVLAIAFGFILRGLTSSQVIHQKLQQATRSLGKTTTISWSQAQFFFRRGIFIPQLSVRVQNVKVVSFEPCWGEPILFTKEVELPLSITGWMSHGQPLQSLILKDSFLEFRSEIKCNQQQASMSTEVQMNSESPVKSVRIKTKNDGVSRPPVVIRDFQFEGLKVRNSVWIMTDWDLKNLQVQVQENQPWYVILNSNFVIPETNGVDSNVNLKLIYKEFPSPVVDLSMRGHWREGSFNIAGNWNEKLKFWNIKTEFNNFPFQFLKILANKTKTPWNWPDRPMWFSFVSESSNASDDWKKSKHLLRNISIEGDLGELKSPDLRITSLQPFQVSPFVFNIVKADLETSLRSQFQKIQEVQNLGFLTGQGEWVSQNELRFRGQWNGSQWSLKGHWPMIADFEVQDSNVQAQLVKGRWDINIINPQINGLKIFGEIKLHGPQNLKQGQLKSDLHADQFPFKLNQNALIGSQNFKITNDYKWGGGKTEETVNMNISSFELENLKFENFNLSMKKKSDLLGSTDMKSYVEKVTFKKLGIPEIEKIDLFKTFPTQMGFSTLSLKRNMNNELYYWTLTLPQLTSTGDLEAETNKINGHIRYKNQKYTVSGTLDNPQVTK